MNEPTALEPRPATAPRPRRWLRRVVSLPPLLALLVGAYYAGGAFVAHRVDTDPTFASGVVVPDGGSRTVAALAALVEREVDRQGWVANDPVFLPGALLDGMAAFQIAIRDEVRRTVDDIATAARDAPDADLETALGALTMPGDVWAFDLATSWRPQRTSEAFYREGVAALRRLNARASAGGTAIAVDHAADRVLPRMAASLDDLATAALVHVETRGGRWRDGTASQLFHHAKGVAYTHLVVLQGLAADLPALASAAGFADAVAALTAASALYPTVIANGRADGVVRPAHLAVQAAMLARASEAVASLGAVGMEGNG
jgi:hypothetical protein